MNRSAAIGIGQDALIWLAGEPELLGDLLAVSGSTAGDLAGRSADPDFLGFLLDFVLGEDARVVAFAAAAGLHPQAVAQARTLLPGGDLPNWT